jgi:hypothetical protein
VAGILLQDFGIWSTVLADLDRSFAEIGSKLFVTEFFAQGMNNRKVSHTSRRIIEASFSQMN